MTEGVSLKEAAKRLKRSPASLRRWVRQGAPCVTHDSAGGRGRGSRVDLTSLVDWWTRRELGATGAAASGVDLDRLSVFLLDFLRRGSGLNDRPAHECLSISQTEAAAFLCLLWRYGFLQGHKRPPKELDYTPEVRSLIEIASTGERE